MFCLRKNHLFWILWYLSAFKVSSYLDLFCWNNSLTSFSVFLLLYRFQQMISFPISLWVILYCEGKLPCCFITRPLSSLQSVRIFFVNLMVCFIPIFQISWEGEDVVVAIPGLASMVGFSCFKISLHLYSRWLGFWSFIWAHESQFHCSVTELI